MTAEECYQRLGGNLSEVLKRLPNMAFIHRFMAVFTEDSTFRMLCTYMRGGQRRDAFRAAHTLKGICLNLGFGRLGDSARELTELLRGDGDEIPEGAVAAWEAVCRDYDETVGVLGTYLEQG